MPETAQLLLFLAAALVVALSPGPGMLYVGARSLAGGRAEGIDGGDNAGGEGATAGRQVKVLAFGICGRQADAALLECGQGGFGREAWVVIQKLDGGGEDG